VRKASILAQNAVSKLDTQSASSRFGDADVRARSVPGANSNPLALLISLFGLRILQLRSRVSRVCQELATGLKPQERPSDCEHIHPEGCRDPAFSDTGGVLVFIRGNTRLTFPAAVERGTRSPHRARNNFPSPAREIVIHHRKRWLTRSPRRHYSLNGRLWNIGRNFRITPA
jgi:hypothetical protein